MLKTVMEMAIVWEVSVIARMVGTALPVEDQFVLNCAMGTDFAPPIGHVYVNRDIVANLVKYILALMIVTVKIMEYAISSSAYAELNITVSTVLRRDAPWIVRIGGNVKMENAAAK